MSRKVVISLVILLLFTSHPISVINSTGNSEVKTNQEFEESIENISDKDISLIDPINDENLYEKYNDNNIEFNYRRIKDDEINRIKSAFNQSTKINSESGGSNVIWSKQGKEDLIKSTKVVDNLKINQDAPDSKDLSESPYFPEVKGQGLQGSCAAWAITYYSYGFLEAKEKDWRGASEGNLDHLMSPSWTFNKVYCTGSGSSVKENAEIINNWGVSTWSNLTYSQNDDVNWGNESAFRDSVKHRGKDLFHLGFNESNTIDELKTLLNSEIPVTFSIDSSQFSDVLSESDTVISSKEYKDEIPDHSNTLVGYDNNVSDDGEKGAFKAVNSWGKNFGDDGYYWITYDTIKKMGLLSNLQYITDRVNYQPSLVATFEFEEQPPRMGNISLSIIDDRGEKKTKEFYYEFDPNLENTLPSFMALDISEFSDWWNEGYDAETFELNIGASFGEISSFRVEYYQDNYKPNNPDYISEESNGVPSKTPSKVKVDFYGPSNIITTEPKLKDKQVPYANDVSVTFTESMDTSVIPKLEQVKGKDPDGWNFEGWSSINTENDTATWSHNPWDVMENITLRISGYVNESGYEGKPYQWNFKTSTYDPINIGSHSDFVEYANDFGWKGDGSEDGPWTIENIEIDGESTNHCVFISGTDDHFLIRNSTFYNAKTGLYFVTASNGIIKNNTINDVGNNINLKDSNNMNFSGNKLKIEPEKSNDYHNYGLAVVIQDSVDNKFLNNRLTTSLNDSFAFQIENSENNLLENNIIRGFYGGIYILKSKDCEFKDNFIDSKFYGIYFRDSENFKFYNNTLSEKGFLLMGTSIRDFDSHIIESNTVDGEPIIYHKNNSNIEFRDEIGQLIMVNSSDSTIRNKEFDKDPPVQVFFSKNISVINCSIESNIYSPFGLFFQFSDNITIDGCEFGKSSMYLYKTNGSKLINNVFKKVSKDSLNWTDWVFGIYLTYSDDNLIKNNYITGREIGISTYEITNCKVIQNTISYTTSWGIGNRYAKNNIFYHNNFYENKNPAVVKPNYENKWDNGYPSGGNYWSQFDGVDKNGDGIADSNYTVSGMGDENVDRYPLMNPFKPWDEVNLPKEILSVQPTPNSFNVSLDEDIRIVFNGSLNTSHTPVIERIGNNTMEWEFLGFSNTNVENDTVMWSHGEWNMDEKVSLRVSYRLKDKSSSSDYTFSFTTYEETSPSITDLSLDVIKMGENYTFLAEIKDNTGIEKAEVEYWFDGNKTTSQLYNIYGDKYKFKLKTPNSAKDLRYVFRAKDTSGNSAVTGEKNLTLIDDSAPVIKINEIDKIQVFENVTFDGSESYDNIGIKDYYWEIDGQTFNKSTINISFSEIGRIRATFAVVDYSGNWNYKDMIYTVNDFIKPIARGGGNRTVSINQEIVLDAGNSTDNYGIRDYIWKFNNMTFKGEKIRYTFTEFGTYIINLTVVDIAGNTDSVNLTYTVRDLIPPKADAGDDISCTVGNQIVLDGSSSYDDYYINRYLWDIEGSIYKGKTLDYTFHKPGEYKVTLEVVDLAGNSDKDSVNVTVNPGLVNVGPIRDQDGKRLKDVQVELIHEGESIDNNRTSKNGTTTFKMNFDPDGEEFSIKLKDERFDDIKKRSFTGSDTGDISVKTDDDYLIPVTIASIAALLLIVLWVYRRKLNGF
ncbi:MAG: PKD domain-containing protein [Thermoplasmata archaeon]